MPDFDPKTIPTLDDVIEPVVREDSESNGESKSGNKETDPIAVIESEPALFSAEPIVDFSDEPETSYDTSHETLFDLADNEETALDLKDDSAELINEENSENFESALIDYDAKESLSPTDTESLTEESEIDEQPVTVQSPTLISETNLQSISDEIVLQLMPDLEQRLRVLVQQVLEEKLPPEIIQFDTTSTTNTSK